MTKEALQEQHRMIIGINHGSSEDATKLSIEYTISVLESLEPKEPPFVVSDGEIKRKITELRNLLLK